MINAVEAWRRILFFLVVALSATLNAFSVAAETPENAVEKNSPAKQYRRIVSMAPVLTELIYKLGGESSLAGRSSGCTLPEAAKSLPVCGDYTMPKVELVAAQRADLLISDMIFQSTAVAALGNLGIKVELLPLEKIADYKKSLRRLGELLNREKAAAKELKQLEEFIQNREAKQRENVAAVKPKILIVVWDSPLIVAGGGSYLNYYISLAGGVNAAEKISQDYFKCSVEWVLKNPPDIIIFPGKSADKPLPLGFEMLLVVKNNLVFTDVKADTLFRANIYIESAVKYIENCIERFRKK
ncbi:MAG: helical backbone metal receptor [Victivallaceae bacterium]